MLLLSSSATFSQNQLDPIYQRVKCERSKCDIVDLARMELVKAGKYSTGHDWALEGMVERCKAVQGRVKRERFRQVRAVQGRTRTDSTGQIRQMCCTAHNIAEHNDPSKWFRYISSPSVIFIKLFLSKLFESILYM